MNKEEIIRLIIATCLGYTVIFISMWLFGRKNKKERLNNEKENNDTNKEASS